MTKMFKSLFAAIVATQIASAAWAQSSDSGWLDSLRAQLLFDKKCVVEYFINMRENRGASGNTFSARVQCEDGRRFDATRSDPDEDFTLETCEQQVCELPPKKDIKS